MIRLFPQIENIGFPHFYSSGFPSSGTYQRMCPPLFPLYLLSNLAAKIPLGSLLNLAHRSLFRPVCICPTEQSPLLDTIRISVLCFQDPSDALSVAYQCCIEIKINSKATHWMCPTLNVWTRGRLDQRGAQSICIQHRGQYEKPA